MTRTCKKTTSNRAAKILPTRAMVLAALLVFAGGVFNTQAEPDHASSPRQLYNDGTQKLKQGKLQEAEACLQSALAGQDERVQPPALYNLGQVRFKEGAEELKKGPSPQAVNANSQHAGDVGDSAIRAVDQALASDDLNLMINAYLNGKGARKELKAASEAVKRAMETYGGVLTHWQRSSGDFKSTYELTPSDSDAKKNAEIVDRNIARLVDQQQMMAMAAAGLGPKRDELAKKMAGLKKKLPADFGQKPGGKGDDDEDEDEPPKLPKAGDQEPGAKNGKQMELTVEEAARLLDMLKLDSNRKLSLGTNGLGKPANHTGRDW